MNITSFLSARDICMYGSKPTNIDFAFDKLSLSRQYVFTDSNDLGAPPLACALSGQQLAVANDGGDVVVLNKHDLTETMKWSAHNNAIFDIKWTPHCDHHLATASGDKSIVIWDINSSQAIQTQALESAHNGSIKSIHFDDNNVLASGSRDGLIKIWDLRCSKGGAVIVIESAHLSRLPAMKASPKARSNKTSLLNSVTCVLFHPLSHHLYSSGANDATIKMWDLRKCRKNRVNSSPSTTPLRHFPYKGGKNCAHGFTNLAFTSNYSLFASCSDHSIYGYYQINESNSNLPTFKCTGHQVNNFTRICALNDNYLVSGSVIGKAFIWTLDWKLANSSVCNKVRPLCGLNHSEDEVTAVVGDYQCLNIYTCCDNQAISKWSLADNSRINGYVDDNNKCELFDRNATEIEVMEVISPSKSAPTVTVTPFASLTNWLSLSAKYHTSNTTSPSDSNIKRARLTNSTPSNKSLFKENNARDKSSKRKLFENNKKISDYFSHS